MNTRLRQSLFGKLILQVEYTTEREVTTCWQTCETDTLIQKHWRDATILDITEQTNEST